MNLEKEIDMMEKNGYVSTYKAADIVGMGQGSNTKKYFIENGVHHWACQHKTKTYRYWSVADLKKIPKLIQPIAIPTIQPTPTPTIQPISDVTVISDELKNRLNLLEKWAIYNGFPARLNSVS